MAVTDTYCLVYINPQGFAQSTLESMKDTILAGVDGDTGQVMFVETALPFRDLLAKARANSSLDIECFYILDKGGAETGGLLCVETRVHVDVKGMVYRYPSAAATRRF